MDLNINVNMQLEHLNMKNKIYQTILILLLTVVSTGCSNGRGLLYGNVSKVATKKIKQFCKQENDIELTNCGYFCLAPEKTLYLDFTVYRELNQNEARKLCIYLLENIRDIFNTTEDMRSYLNDYPCSITDFSILILFIDPITRYQDHDFCKGPNSMAMVGTCKGYVNYKVYDHDLKGTRLLDQELIMKAQSIAKFKSD